MHRIRLTPGALYAVLTDELRRKRTWACNCRTPLPYRVARPDDVSANWRIGTPTPCANGCDALIVEIATGLWPQYDLLDPTSESQVESPEPAASQKTD